MPMTFDLETGPGTPETIALLSAGYREPDPPKHPGDFDADAVMAALKVDYKKQETIDKHFAARQAEHAKLIEKFEYESQDKDRAAKHREAWVKDKLAESALDPFTNRILCASIYDSDMARAGEPPVVLMMDDLEADLPEFMNTLFSFFNSNGKDTLFGHNIKPFDCPTLRVKAMQIGKPNYLKFLYQLPMGRWGNFQRNIVDLGEEWLAGSDRKAVKWSLDTLCQFFGLPGKSGDGKHAWEWWQNDRERLASYASDDALCTWNLGKVMGVTQ